MVSRDWKILLVVVITGTGYLIPSVLYRSTSVICQYDGDRILRPCLNLNIRALLSSKFHVHCEFAH